MSEHEDPIIWFIVRDYTGIRLDTSVAYTMEQALADAKSRYGQAVHVEDSGRRKPEGKCCNKCGDKPCS